MFIDPRVAGRTAKNFGSVTKVTYGLGGNDASLARQFAQEVAKRSALQAQSKIPVSAGVTVSKPLVPNTATPSPVVSGTAQKLAIAKGVAGFLAIAALAEVGAQTIAAAGEMSQSTLSAADAGVASAKASERIAEAKLEQALQRDRERKQRQRDKQNSDQREAINGALAPRIPPSNLPQGNPDNPFPTGQTVHFMVQLFDVDGGMPRYGTANNVRAVRTVNIGNYEFFQFLDTNGTWGNSNFSYWWRPASNTANNHPSFQSPPRGYLVNSSITIGGKTYTGAPAQVANPPYLPNDGQAPPANNPPSNFKPPTLGKGLSSQLGKPKPKSPTPRIPPQQQKQENPTPTPSSPVSQKPDLPAPSQPLPTGSTKGRSFIEINGQKIFLDEPFKQSFIEFGNGDVVDLSNRPKTPSYIEFADGRRINLEPQKTPSFIEIGGKRINLDSKPNEPSFMEVNGVKTYFTQENQPSFIEINGVRTYLPSAAPTAPVTTPTTPKPPEKQEEERRAVPFTPIIPNTPTEIPRIPTVPPQPTNPVQPNPNQVPIPTPNITPINPTQPTPTPNPTPTQTPNSTPTNPPPNLEDIIELTVSTVGGIELLKQAVNNLTNKVTTIDANTSPESLANAAQTGNCRSLKDSNCTTLLKDAIVNQLLDALRNLIEDNSCFNFESIEISYKVCDAEGNETTQTESVQVPANSTGSLESLTKAIFNAINSLHDCPSDAILALPEWYQKKAEGAIPQAAVLLYGGNKSYWTFHIPHYNKPKSFKPVLPSFVKGSFYGKLILKDGSRVLIYAKNKAEAQKVINAVIPLINPSMISSPPNITYGEKQGTSLKETEVKPTRVMYYSKGLRDTKPDWIIYLD